MLQSRFEQLKRLYPSAAVMERASAVVGPMGLRVGFVGPGGIGCKSYSPGETVPIIGIELNQLWIDIGVSQKIKRAVINHALFSDFS